MFLALAWLPLLAVAAVAQVTVNVVLTNGPASNRFNIAILSEGYTAGQLADFRAHASNAVNNLLSRAPFSEYRQYFNAHSISVPSNQSGSDHPGSSLYRDTYFNTTYDNVSDRVISFPTNALGQGKVDALLQQFLDDGYHFKQLKRKGILKPHAVTKTYLVKDLRAVLGLDHEDGQVQETHAAGRHQETTVQVRPRSRGKVGRGSQAPHPLD